MVLQAAEAALARAKIALLRIEACTSAQAVGDLADDLPRWRACVQASSSPASKNKGVNPRTAIYSRRIFRRFISRRCR